MVYIKSGLISNPFISRSFLVINILVLFIQYGSIIIEGKRTLQKKGSFYSSYRKETNKLRFCIAQEEEAQSRQGELLRVQSGCW